VKDSELEQLLKSAPVPPRPESYWDSFPRRVMAKIHWLPAETVETVSRPLEPGITPLKRGVNEMPRWRGFRFATLGLGMVVIGLLLAYVVGFRQGRNLSITDLQIVAARKYFQEVEALFPGQVQAIVFGQQGAQLVLADKPNVPTSSPIYLRICGPQGCQNYVTFSGQQIRFNGEVCEVLEDHQGNVLLVGRQMVWSSAQAAAKGSRYQIEARPLEVTS
jgi:hypothetical protein